MFVLMQSVWNTNFFQNLIEENLYLPLLTNCVGCNSTYTAEMTALAEQAAQLQEICQF